MLNVQGHILVVDQGNVFGVPRLLVSVLEPIAHSAENSIYLSQFVREVTFHVAVYSCQANLPVNRIG